VRPERLLKPCKKCGKVERNARGDCKPCKRAWQDAWRQQNAGEKSRRNREWYEKRKEHVIAKSREWHRNNPEKAKEFVLRYKARNPEKYKDSRLRSRHKSRGAPGELSKGIVQKLLAAQNGLCACCGTPLLDNFEIDHIIPISLGGPNTDDNVQLLTPLCNKRKGRKHPFQAGTTTPGTIWTCGFEE